MAIRRDNRRQVVAQIRSIAARALNDGAGELLRKANETVPKEEGVLESSGHVIDATSDKLTAGVGYGGEAQAYALKQHEDTTLQHDPGRRAKWLELAFKEDGKRVMDWVGREMKRKLS